MDKHGGYYEIYVREQLAASWSQWFAGLYIEHHPSGSIIMGYLPDQSALHGILRQVADLGLTLLAVERFDLNGAKSIEVENTK
jgi:hypothetical protein